jgi:anti-anti-sigma factor
MTMQQSDGRGMGTVSDIDSRRSGGSSVFVQSSVSGRWTIVRVDGEMDIQVPPLVDHLLEGAGAHLLFELAGVTFLDASGLGFLFGRQRRAVEGGGCLRLIAPSLPVRRLLEITGSERAFPAFDSVDEATRAPTDHDLTVIRSDEDPGVAPPD